MTDSPTTVLNIYNTIIFDNIAPGSGVDIYVENLSEKAKNIYDNDFSTTEDSGFFVEDASNLRMSYNLDNVDPLFANVMTGGYHLTEQSPVIVMGDNSAPDVPSEDPDGFPRPVNGTVDMGAYEYQDAVSTTTTTIPGGTGSGGGCFIGTAANDSHIPKNPLSTWYLVLLLGLFLVGLLPPGLDKK